MPCAGAPLLSCRQGRLLEVLAEERDDFADAVSPSCGITTRSGAAAGRGAQRRLGGAHGERAGEFDLPLWLQRRADLGGEGDHLRRSGRRSGAPRTGVAHPRPDGVCRPERRVSARAQRPGRPAHLRRWVEPDLHRSATAVRWLQLCTARPRTVHAPDRLAHPRRGGLNGESVLGARHRVSDRAGQQRRRLPARLPRHRPSRGPVAAARALEDHLGPAGPERVLAGDTGRRSAHLPRVGARGSVSC